MNRLVYLLMVGLAFTVLQISTVEAQAPTAPPMGDPSGMPPMGDPSGVPPMGDPSGMPPMGDAAAKPSLGERVKSFFGMGKKDATPPAGDPNMPPPVPADPMGTAGAPPTGAPVLTIGDPACATVPAAAGCPAGSPGLMAPPMGDPNMPPPVPADPMGTAGAPPTGDQSGMPPAGQ